MSSPWTGDTKIDEFLQILNGSHGSHFIDEKAKKSFKDQRVKFVKNLQNASDLTWKSLALPKPVEDAIKLALTTKETTPEPVAATKKAKALDSKRYVIGKDESGAVIDKYILENNLGAGAFCSVYRAQHKKTKKLVAIKIRRGEIDVEALPENTAHNEERIFRVLGPHKNIISFIDAAFTVELRAKDGTRRETDYIVLELGMTSARTVIQETGAFDNECARWWFAQFLNAVGFCHKRGVVHRDLKPTQVLFTHRLELKLCDFDSASHFEDQASNDATRVGGSPLFMAPEVYRHWRESTERRKRRSEMRGPRTSSLPNDQAVNDPEKKSSNPRPTGPGPPDSSHSPTSTESSSSSSSSSTAPSEKKGLFPIPETEATSPHRAASSTTSTNSEHQATLEGLNSAMIDVWGCGLFLFYILVGEDIFYNQANGPHLQFWNQILQASQKLNSKANILLHKLLQLDPAQRPTIEEVLKDPWLTGGRLDQVAAEADLARRFLKIFGENWSEKNKLSEIEEKENSKSSGSSGSDSDYLNENDLSQPRSSGSGVGSLSGSQKRETKRELTFPITIQTDTPDPTSTSIRITKEDPTSIALTALSMALSPATVPDREENHPTTKSGFLLKKGKINWKRRWVHVTTRGVEYNPQAQQLAEEIYKAYLDEGLATRLQSKGLQWDFCDDPFLQFAILERSSHFSVLLRIVFGETKTTPTKTPSPRTSATAFRGSNPISLADSTLYLLKRELYRRAISFQSIKNFSLSKSTSSPIGQLTLEAKKGDKKDEILPLKFKSLQDAKDFEALLTSCLSHKVTGFNQMGQLILHQGWVERKKRLTWEKMYLRLVMNRLLCYRHEKSHVAFDVLPLSGATGRASIRSYTFSEKDQRAFQLSGDHFKKPVIFRCSTPPERDVWLEGLNLEMDSKVFEMFPIKNVFNYSSSLSSSGPTSPLSTIPSPSLSTQTSAFPTTPSPSVFFAPSPSISQVQTPVLSSKLSSEDTKTVPWVQVKRVEPTDQESKPYAMIIHTIQKKKIIFAAQTAPERERWMYALNYFWKNELRRQSSTDSKKLTPRSGNRGSHSTSSSPSHSVSGPLGPQASSSSSVSSSTTLFLVS